MIDDPYDVLGVAPNAPPEVVTGAYRALARASHPDGGTVPDPERMAKINEAYRILSDPQRRAELDRARLAPPSPQDWSGSPSGGQVPDLASPDPAWPPAGDPDGQSQSPPSFGAPPPPPPILRSAGYPSVPPAGGMAPLQATRTNTLAWVSFLITLFCFPFLGLVLALIARRQILNSNGAQTGMGWVYLSFGWVVFVIAALFGLYLLTSGSNPQ